MRAGIEAQAPPTKFKSGLHVLQYRVERRVFLKLPVPAYWILFILLPTYSGRHIRSYLHCGYPASVVVCGEGERQSYCNSTPAASILLTRLLELWTRSIQDMAAISETYP